ncbi:OTU domain-containing protein [Roseateles sp. YR242]|uniref:OTU domain-containing protein n=1 Tax=Roseateles sp. YR242 TaxID=1855305 RepID=UPI001C434379|nr:OTU domain-containing protein [Roseateles sp. YR242]
MAEIEARLREVGRISARHVLVNVNHDGNCFFHALIRVAGPDVRNAVIGRFQIDTLTVPPIRQALAEAVLDHFIALNEKPERDKELSLKSDPLAEILSAMSDLKPSTSGDEEGLLLAEQDRAKYRKLQPYQQAVVESLARNHSWGWEAHALTPFIACMLLRVRIAIIPESADTQGRRILMPTQYFPDATGPAVLLYSRDVPGQPAHYMAVVDPSELQREKS